MLKHFMAVAAVSGLALTSALAQTTAPSGTTTPPTAATPAAPAPKASAAVSPAGKANFVTTQTSDQHLASKFNGTDVTGGALTSQAAF